MAKIELQGLVKEYGKTRAVHGIDLTIEVVVDAVADLEVSAAIVARDFVD